MNVGFDVNSNIHIGYLPWNLGEFDAYGNKIAKPPFSYGGIFNIYGKKLADLPGGCGNALTCPISNKRIAVGFSEGIYNIEQWNGRNYADPVLRRIKETDGEYWNYFSLHGDYYSVIVTFGHNNDSKLIICRTENDERVFEIDLDGDPTYIGAGYTLLKSHGKYLLVNHSGIVEEIENEYSMNKYKKIRIKQMGNDSKFLFFMVGDHSVKFLH